MKKLYPVLFVFCIISSLYSQNKTPIYQTVKGQVLDSSTKLPLEFATISFQEKTEGSMPIGTITDDKGNFKLSVPTGTYDITFDFLSFQPFQLINVSILKDLNLNPVTLKSTLENLAEIQVTASNKAAVIKLDRMVYLVDKDLTVTGGSALNALNSVPNVSVNAEGLVSLRNDPHVKILVNGKQSAQSNADVLNNLNAEAIEKIEVITVPSSRFSAEGTGGIINIILKKGKGSGLNTTINLTAGDPDYYGFATNVNFKKDKFNIYNTTGYLQRESPGSSYIHNEFISNNTTTAYLNDDRTYKRDKAVFNSMLGIDYEINPTTTFNVTVTLNLVDGDDITTNDSNYLDVINTNEQKFERFDNSKINSDLFEISVGYSKQFEKEGHQLSINYAREKTLNKTNSDFNNFVYDNTIRIPKIIDDFVILNKHNETYQLFDIYYSLPFGKNSLFEMGYEGYFVDLNTDYNYNSYDSTSQTFINNSNFSNVFNYSDKVHSFFSRFESSLGKLSYSAGLRIERADLDFNLENSTVSYAHNKTELFPSTHISYEFSESSNLTFSYGKRISRPVYWILNPFETKISETNIVVGNPEMEPFFIHLYELKHVKRVDKFTLSSTLFIKDYTNAPERVTFSTGELINEIPVELTTYKNIASLHQIGFEQYANFKLFKWWNLAAGYSIYNSEQEGIFEYIDFNNNPKTIDFSSTDLSGYGSLSSKFTLPQEWILQANYKYYAPSEGAISKRKEYNYVDLALSKNLWSNKASLTLSVTDLFNSNKIERIVNTAAARTNNMIQWNERMLLLNFSYRFNQNDKKLNFEVDKDRSIMF